jgi:hypothetical protein
VPRAVAIAAATSSSITVTRGSSRQPAVSSAIGPRAQAMISGTSSATTTDAFGGSAASAARNVKPMP